MNVANLELSKKLHELSGWKDTVVIWAQQPDIGKWELYSPKYDNSDFGTLWNGGHADEVPAYDAGYLLRKLPKEFEDYWFDLSVTNNDSWVAEYFTNDYTPDRPMFKFKVEDAVVEDALALLAIKLIEKGVIDGKV